MLASSPIAQFARRVLRRFPTGRKLVEPLVRGVESFRLRRTASYRAQDVAPETLEIVYQDKSYRIMGADNAFCKIGLSRQERPTISAILACLHEGMIAWDIGANVGFYSALMSQIVGPTGRVFAFEPNPDAFSEMERQLAANDVPCVTALRVALSERNGEVQMLANPGYTQVSRVVSSASLSMGQRLLPTAAFGGDSLIAQGRVSQPSFIKLDVEGHEISVIKGMQKLLSSPKMNAIVCEVHFALLEDAGINDALSKIHRYFNDCGLVHQIWISRSHLLARR
jgi:FkbM family methyltransferase